MIAMMLALSPGNPCLCLRFDTKYRLIQEDQSEPVLPTFRMCSFLNCERTDNAQPRSEKALLRYSRCEQHGCRLLEAREKHSFPDQPSPS